MSNAAMDLTQGLFVQVQLALGLSIDAWRDMSSLYPFDLCCYSTVKRSFVESHTVRRLKGTFVVAYVAATVPFNSGFLTPVACTLIPFVLASYCERTLVVSQDIAHYELQATYSLRGKWTHLLFTHS